VIYKTSPDSKALAAAIPSLTYSGTTADGYAEYQLKVAGAVAPEAAMGTLYVVVKGDTLYAIGLKYHTTWQKLAAYNKLSNPHLIQIGQQINIPAN
jgi:2',3'-cyclic-nucleotide 2'-phosphodiesterase/3'-nucleotidase